jgi:hypothetical protein
VARRIEVGKFYQDASGRKVEIIREITAGHFRFVGVVTVGRGHYERVDTYSLEGDPGEGSANGLLVSEWVDPEPRLLAWKVPYLDQSGPKSFIYWGLVFMPEGREPPNPLYTDTYKEKPVRCPRFDDPLPAPAEEIPRGTDGV